MKLSRRLSVLSAILVVTLFAAACTFVIQPPAEEPAAAPMEEASDWVAPEDALDLYAGRRSAGAGWYGRRFSLG